MEKQRNLAIDILKVLAALMITNSHLKPLYIDPFTPLGTFGAPGNALFFFISGYGLCLGRWSDFNTWYSRRISRIIPSLIMWFGLLAVPFYYLGTHSFQELLFMSEGYWFIRCIFIYYLLYYIVRSFRVSYKKALLVSFMVSVLAFLYFHMYPLLFMPVAIIMYVSWLLFSWDVICRNIKLNVGAVFVLKYF